MKKPFLKPFSINQIVKAQVSFRPLVVAGNYYRVAQIYPSQSYSRWMVGVTWLRKMKNSKSSAILETLDAGYFSKMDEAIARERIAKDIVNGI